MLKIRKKQMVVLLPPQREKFVKAVHEYMRVNYPEDCEVLGTVQTRRVINLGIDRAAAYGVEVRGDVCSYITLMFSLGSYFDEDPLLPWAAEVLVNREIERPAAMVELYAAAKNYLRLIAGEDGKCYRRALLRLRRETFQSFSELDTGDLKQDIKTTIKRIYPEQYRVLPPNALEEMILAAGDMAAKAGLVTREGVFICAGLIFMMGSHFDRDPLHPWAGEILHHDHASDPIVKAKSLFDAALARIEQAFRSVNSESSG